MTSSTIERPQIQGVDVTDEELTVELSDGRTVSVPTAWYPRLAHGTASERRSIRILGNGHGIHRPLLDEDLSVENLLTGKPSAESAGSLKKWLEERGKGK